jgi:hypothetical protein
MTLSGSSLYRYRELVGGQN